MPKKNFKINLSNNGIKEAIKKLETLKENINKADEEIVKQLSELGLREIQDNYSRTPYKDGNEDVGFFTVGSTKKKKIGVSGSQVLYNEFGTGTKGERSPHPEKNNYGLNAYNSGKTIRRNMKQGSNATQNGIPEGELYWTYMENGEKHYTQGIPAGKQVYNAVNTLKKEKQTIIKKVVGDALSKL